MTKSDPPADSTSQPLRGRVQKIRSSLPRTRTIVGALVFIGAIPTTISLISLWVDSDEWNADDWAALANSVVLGIAFLWAAWIINQRAERRSAALADSFLVSTVGKLDLSSTRTFAGSDDLALSVAPEAQAALKYFDLATPDEQGKLLLAIRDAYSSLAFGTLSRVNSIPRSLWVGVEKGAKSLSEVVSVLKVADGYDFTKYPSPEQVCMHLSTILAVSSELRNLPASKRGHVALKGILTLEHLKALYSRELTVLSNWDLLEAEGNRDAVSCRLELVDASDDAVSGWITPWYLQLDDDTLKPVSYDGTDLSQDAAMDDRVEVNGDTPLWPHPLSVSSVPSDLRKTAISRLTGLMGEVSYSRTSSCLLYEMQLPNGSQARLILDGNHRVIAMRKAAEMDPGISHILIAYVISESTPILGMNHNSQSQVDPVKGVWCGFTPDVDKVRANNG